jgi:hypothetical protein
MLLYPSSILPMLPSKSEPVIQPEMDASIIEVTIKPAIDPQIIMIFFIVLMFWFAQN